MLIMARPHGSKYIKTPQLMWDLFCAYREKTKNTPFLQHDFVGKDGESVRREKERCLTMEGFQEYVADCEEVATSYPDLTDYFTNRDDRYSDYIQICSRIKNAIRRDQVEGGMAGIYNPSITQRLNNLVERTQNEVKIEQPLFGEDKDDE